MEQIHEDSGSDISGFKLSNRAQSIQQAMSIYFNQLVSSIKQKGIPIKVLSLGEAFFDIPLFPFDKLDVERGYHYSDSQGIFELREKIAAYQKKRYKLDISPEKEILISSGSKPLVYMSLQAILNPGDEVLIPEPAWLSYPEHVRLLDGKPVFIPYDVAPEHYTDFITERSKVLILNNPNNPAGRRYTHEELKQLYLTCHERGIFILSDEAYSDFTPDGNFISLWGMCEAFGEGDKRGIIVVNSLSKNLGISGWRVGYVIAEEKFIQAVLKLNQHLLTCPSTLLLLYLNAYFDKITALTLPQARETVIKRRKIVEYIKSRGMDCLPGDSSFYIMLNLGEYRHSSMEFAMYLLFKYHIAVVPGRAYGESTEHFVRLGVGVETMESMKYSLDIMLDVIKSNAYDEELVKKMLKELKM